MGSGTRIRRTIEEKRRIVELALEPGASVARIAQAEGVNANQIFQWRRAYRSGGLSETSNRSIALLPVAVREQEENVLEAEEPDGPVAPQEAATVGGTINIEFPGRALVSIERGASPAVVRAIVESLRR
jgi:transposase